MACFSPHLEVSQFVVPSHDSHSYMGEGSNPIPAFTSFGKTLIHILSLSTRVLNVLLAITAVTMIACIALRKDSTVKSALVTTCLQRPPVYKDHIFVSLENGFSLKHVLKEPVYKDHFLCFPWAVAVDRFDCISVVMRLTLAKQNDYYYYYYYHSQSIFSTTPTTRSFMVAARHFAVSRKSSWLIVPAAP